MSWFKRDNLSIGNTSEPTMDFQGTCCHQTFQVPKMEVLSLVRLFWGWIFPYISLTYCLYRWGFLHFRYLKCLVMLVSQGVIQFGVPQIGTSPQCCPKEFDSPLVLPRVVALPDIGNVTWDEAPPRWGWNNPTWMSQEVSKWLVSGLYPQYTPFIRGL